MKATMWKKIYQGLVAYGMRCMEKLGYSLDSG